MAKIANVQQDSDDQTSLASLDFISNVPLDIVTEYLRYHKDLIEITLHSGEKL